MIPYKSAKFTLDSAEAVSLVNSLCNSKAKLRAGGRMFLSGTIVTYRPCIETSVKGVPGYFPIQMPNDTPFFATHEERDEALNWLNAQLKKATPPQRAARSCEEKNVRANSQTASAREVNNVRPKNKG